MQACEHTWATRHVQRKHDGMETTATQSLTLRYSFTEKGSEVCLREKRYRVVDMGPYIRRKAVSVDSAYRLQ